MKTLTPEFSNALGTGAVRTGFIAEIEHPAGIIRVWSGVGSLRWSPPDRIVLWDFSNGLQDWIAFNANISISGDVLVVDTTAINPAIRPPAGLNIDGAKFGIVRAFMRRTSGTDFVGRLSYDSTGSGIDFGIRSIAPEPANFGSFQTVEWDMLNLDGSGPEWKDGVIGEFQMNIGSFTDADDDYEIEFVEVVPHPDQSTWKGLGQMGRISGLGQTAEVRTKETKYQLIGASVDAEVESQIADAGIAGNLARCWFSLFDENWNVIGDPILIDQTILDHGSIKQEKTADMQMNEILTLHGQSAIFNLGSPSRLRATNEEQQKAFPGDTGFDRLPTEVADKEIKWTFN